MKDSRHIRHALPVTEEHAARLLDLWIEWGQATAKEVDLKKPRHRALRNFYRRKLWGTNGPYKSPYASPKALRWEAHKKDLMERIRNKVPHEPLSFADTPIAKKCEQERKRKQAKKLKQAKQRSKEKRRSKKHVIRGQNRVALRDVPQALYIEPRIFRAMSCVDRQALLRKRDQVLRDQKRQANRKRREQERLKNALHRKVKTLVSYRMNHLLIFHMEELFQGTSISMNFSASEIQLLQSYRKAFPKMHISPVPMQSSRPRTRWRPLDLVHYLTCDYLNCLTGAYEDASWKLIDTFLVQQLVKQHEHLDGAHTAIQWNPEKWSKGWVTEMMGRTGEKF